MRTLRGNSLIMWTITFSVLIATLFLFRITFKRILQGKVMQSTDYFLWTSYEQAKGQFPPQQYKGDDNSFSKTVADQNQLSRQRETNASVSIEGNIKSEEKAASSSVADGSQPVLKTFDLNTLVD